MTTGGRLVGRDEELELIGAGRRAGGGGIVVSGAAGVGKSRLAADASAAAVADGWAAVEVRATPGLGRLPMAAFIGFLGLRPCPNPSDAIAAALAEFGRRADGRPLVLRIDDAHLLDDVSAAFAYQVAATRTAFVIATVRTGEPRPADLTALWMDGVAERVELQALSADETAVLAAELLGAEVDVSAQHRIWAETEGNPLFVRELLLAGVESGRLVRGEGRWQMQGPPCTGGRLREVVEERLRRLGSEDREALELIAVAGSVDSEIVVRLMRTDRLVALEGSGLLAVERRGGRAEVSVAHPIHAEVVRSQVLPLRTTALLGQLAEAVEAAGTLSPRDRIRVAVWKLEQGVPVDPATLVAASDAAQWSVAESLVAKLDAAMNLGYPVGDAEYAVVRWQPRAGDPELSIRLARAAWAADPAPGTGGALVHALVRVGRLEEADAVLAHLDRTIEAGPSRARVLSARAQLLFAGLGRADDARAALAEALGACSGLAADDRVRVDVVRALAGVELNAGRPAAALAAASELLDVGGEPTALVGAVASAALAWLGRTCEGIELADRCLPLAMAGAEDSALLMGELVMSRGAGLARAGKLTEADALYRVAHDIALASDRLDGTAAYACVLGRIDLWLGRPSSALRRFREAASLLAEVDAFGYRRWALGGIAHCLAALGDVDGARRSVAQADASATAVRFYEPDVRLDLHRVLVAQGRRREAAELAIRSADEAQDAGMVFEEAALRHALVTGTPGVAARAADLARLRALPALGDGSFVPALAAHALAFAARDADGLASAAESLAALGAMSLASEAAATAAEVHGGAGRTRPAAACARRAAELREACEPGAPAAAASGGAGGRLTGREREIALLAAGGRSSKEIAESLIVSVRTVDSHLYRVFAKLGITNRRELAGALGSTASR